MVGPYDKQAIDYYLKGIEEAMRDIDEGKRNPAWVNTLGGITYLLERDCLHPTGPEDVQIPIRGNAYPQGDFKTLNSLRGLLKSDVKEALYFYEQLSK